MKYKVGTRKSQLACTQTEYVVKRIQEKFDVEVDIVKIDTFGDHNLDVGLPFLGEKAVFTKELENALLDHSVDFVIHSLKDLPTQLPQSLIIFPVTPRVNPNDVVIFRDKSLINISQLPVNAIVGTSSLRRIAQIKRKYPHLIIKNIRGNLNTRIRKLQEGLYDALILAYAGLSRLNWLDHISLVLDQNDYFYAVGQGILAVEFLETRDDMINIFQTLIDPETYLQALAERSFLKHIEGGCSAPIGIRSHFDMCCKLTIKCMVCDLNGSHYLESQNSTDLSVSTILPNQPNCMITGIYSAENLIFDGYPNFYHMSCSAERAGINLAKDLISKGGDEILKLAKTQKINF